MTTLITGAGLIGAQVAAELTQRGEKPVIYDVAPSERFLGTVLPLDKAEVVRGDILDIPLLAQTLRDHQVDKVVHTAGLIGPAVEARPYNGVRINLFGTANVFEAARLMGVRRVVFCSTEGVYDWSAVANAPMTEDFPFGYRGLYGASKIAGEFLGFAYQNSCGLDFIALRYCRVYGPGLFAGGSPMGKLIYDLVATAVSEGTVLLHPNAIQPNEFVYVKDVARAIVQACYSEAPRHRILNIGSGVISRVEDLAAALRGAVPGLNVELRDAGDRTPVVGGGRSQPFDLSRAKEGLGYEPRYTLETGLRDMAQQLRESRST